MRKTIEQIAAEDGRYSPEALKFVFDGLGHTVKTLAALQEQGARTAVRHVTGQQLCRGLRELAVRGGGRLARSVLESWGVSGTRDLGEIVYLMIHHQWMSCQTSDSIEDFDNVYNFKTAFEDKFRFEPVKH